MAHAHSKKVALLVVGALCIGATGCGSPRERVARHLARGQEYLARGNVEKARVEFRNALQIAPGDPTARYETGVVEERLGNYPAAAGAYRAALDADADSVQARGALARLTLLAGMPEKALDILQPAFPRHAEDARLLAIRAACESALKDGPAALTDAEHAVRNQPGNVDAVAVLAGLYQSNGETGRARALLEATLHSVPDSVAVRLMLVDLYGALKLLPQTESMLIELTRLRPSDPAQHVRLAQFYAQTRRPQQAESVLRAAIRAMPRNPALKGALIEFLAGARSREAASRELESMLAAEPNDTDLRFQAARFHEQALEYRQAERDYTDIITRARFRAPGLTARNRLAALKVQQGDFTAARRLVEEVLAAAPRDDDAMILRGNLNLRENKDLRSAIADFRAVLRDQPNAVGVMRSLARAHLASGEPVLAAETMRRAVETNPKDTAARLDLAQLMAETGDASQARQLISELAREQPDNAQILDTQFRIAMASGDAQMARSAADALVARQPRSPSGHLYQGMLAEAAQRLDESARHYAQALELQPDAPEPLRRLATVLARQNRLSEAVRRIEAVAQRFPGNTEPMMLEGDLYLAAQRPDDAVAAYRHALAIEGSSAAGYERLARAQLAARDDAAAIATLREGIGKVRRPEPLQLALASLFETRGRTDEAVALYDAVLARDPQADVAANNLAMLLVSTRSDRRSLERAAQLAARFAQSTNPDFLDTYGWVLYKEGESAAAVVALRGVVAKAPDSPVGLYHLGMAQVQAGQLDAARDNLSHALSSGRAFPGAAEARAALERMGTPSGEGTAISTRS